MPAIWLHRTANPKKEEIAFAQSYFAVQTRKQELIEERISLIERTEARGRLRESEKRLSQNIYERGVDDAGFDRIRSTGDQALFGGYTTQEMKERLGVKDSRSLADSLLKLKKHFWQKRDRTKASDDKMSEAFPPSAWTVNRR